MKGRPGPGTTFLISEKYSGRRLSLRHGATAQSRATYTLVLRAEPGNDAPDPAKSLRRLLKAALRQFGFRCTSVTEVREPHDSPHPHQPDLFAAASDDPLVGLRIKLDRGVDQRQPCHDNIREIATARPPHGYALLCTTCGRFRGWLPKRAAVFVAATIREFGIPAAPLTWRDRTSGDGHDAGSPPARRTRERSLRDARW